MNKAKIKKIFITTITLLFFVYMVIISLDHQQREFVSDGCSMWPDYWHYDCCYVHDKAYWEGGNSFDRLKADRNLKQCVAETSSPVLGDLMYYAVRIGGHPIFPVPWRWDFGRPYVGKYKK